MTRTSERIERMPHMQAHLIRCVAQAARWGVRAYDDLDQDIAMWEDSSW
jgi:hypothetical protein